MQRIRYVLIALVFAAQASIAQVVLNVGPEKNDAVVEYRDGQLFYDGHLTDEPVARLIALYEAQEIKPSTLMIRSTGGHDQSGMALGEFVHQHGLAVRVLDYCGSSCANYVFTAATKKILSHDAIVWWHGSMISKGWNIPGTTESYLCQAQETCGTELAEVTKEKYRCMSVPTCEEELRTLDELFNVKFDEWRKRQIALFAAIGVDPEVTVYGQNINCKCVWTFSIDDMRRFNIKDVSTERRVDPNYSTAATRLAAAQIKAKVVKLKVARGYQMRIAAESP
jgi:hypothetical protein